MNTKPTLRDWASEWKTYQALNSIPADEPAAPPPGAATGVDIQVSTGFSPAASILRQLRAAIQPDDAERAATEGMNLVRAGSGAKVALQPGEIRHLSPDLKPGWTREVHVLILAVDEKKQRALAVPFSPLSTPAFESELASGLADASLAVLCLWNSAWIPLAQACRSWLVTSVDEALLKDVADLRACLAKNEALPARLADRIGSPLAHPQDPRQSYADEEENLLEELEELM